MYSSIPYWTFLNYKAWYKYVYDRSTLEIFVDFNQHCEAENLLLLILRQTNPSAVIQKEIELV